MGARRTLVNETHNKELKCEFCPRFFSRPCNLQAHQKSMHPSAIKGKGILPKSAKRVSLGSKNEDNKQSTSAVLRQSQPNKVTGATIQVLKMPLKKDRSQSPMKPEDVEDSEMRTLRSTETRKIEFACPQCDKLYPVYFSALRHIKKYHCVNENGDFVDDSSDEIVKPIRTEICIHCQVRVKSTEIHKCSKNTVEDIGKLYYYCVACKEIFLMMRVFDIHLNKKHSDNVESMFFPNNNAFQKWKRDMESQTRCKFVLKGKYNSKEFYRCLQAHEPEITDAVVLCPSTIIQQEFPKGTQVHFYPSHSGHDYQKYNLTEKYKNVTITNLLHQKTLYKEFSQNIKSVEIDDLYIQFKDLMESIVIDSAKVNRDTLKTLIGKALEMTMVLTNYDVDNDEDLSNNTSVEETDPLAMCTSNGLKKKTRETENNEVPKKKVKIINNIKFSLNDSINDETILKELDDTRLKNASLGIPTQFGQITFNDSYKDFVDKSYKTEKSDSENKKKQKVKTKIGQFKLKESPKTKPDFEKELEKPKIAQFKQKESPKTKPDIKKDLEKPKIAQFKQNESPKTKPDFKKELEKTKIAQFKQKDSPRTKPDLKKELEKPKIAQIKQKDSPKTKPDIKKELEKPRRLSDVTLKDIDYEIQERDDDCNILILKI